MNYTRGSILALLARGVALVFGTIVAIALARWLGPADRGSYGVVTSFAALVVVAINLGLGDAQTHFVGREPSGLGRATANTFVFSLASGIAAAVALVAVAGPLAGEIGAFDDGRTIAIVGITIPALLMYGFAHSLLTAARSFAASAALIASAYILLLVALAICTSLLGAGLIGALVAWSAAHLVLVTLALIVLAREGGIAAPRPSRLVTELRFGSATWVVSLATLLAGRVALLIAGAELEPAEVGRYAVALTLVELLWYASESASVGLGPLVARSTVLDTTAPTGEVIRTVVALTGIAGIVVIAAAEPIVVLMFGPDYAGAADAVRWLVPGVIAFSVFRLLMADLIGRGMPRRGVVSAIVVAVLTIVGSIALVTPLGIVGGAAATTVGYLAGTVLLLRASAAATGTRILELIVPQPSDIGRLWSRLRS